MGIVLNPYLSFNDGLAEEAMTFYHSVFGGELEFSRFGDTPGMELPDDQMNLVMHGHIVAPDLQLFGADSPHERVAHGSDMAISISGDDEAKLTKYYEGLSAGGTITAPLNKAPWGDTFGMFTDKFGIDWMINIAGSPA